MIRKTALFLLPLLMLAQPAEAEDRSEVVRFKAGASSATISGSIRGYDGVNYMLGARAGQMLPVLFSPDNGSCYFNYSAPGADSATHIGSSDGNEFSMRLTHSGNQRVQVYLMRNAARRNETCKYRLTIEIAGGAAGGGGEASEASPRTMMASCRERAHQILRTRLPNIEVKYEGQRTDGTHAVNGSAFIHGRHETFQCSFNDRGNRIVQFIVNRNDDALVPGTNFHATGPISCAQYEGQPYETCQFGVIRQGNGTATVHVFFKDGARRMIHFRDGEAVSSDSDAGVYSDRHTDMMTVYIGTGERYEIPDAVIYGG